MSPFAPHGSVARWKIVYDLLRETETDAVLTYEVMAKALDLDPVADRHPIQMAMRRAAKEHLELDLRSVASVPNEGYQVVPTEQKLDLAGRQQGRAVRAVRRGRAHIDNVDLHGVDDATRAIFEAMAWKFEQQDEALHRLDVRARRHERQLQAVATHQEQTAAELAALAERLARLETERLETEPPQD